MSDAPGVGSGRSPRGGDNTGVGSGRSPRGGDNTEVGSGRSPRGGDNPASRTGLRVTVHRADGEPVPSATLTVLDADGHQVARGHTDADGGFHAVVPRPGEYLLIAAAGGHDPQSSTLALHAPGEHAVDVVLPGRRGGLAGTVTGGSGPVSGATVVVYDRRGDVVCTTHTDTGGAYAVPDLSPGTYTVVAGAPGVDPVTDAVAVERSRSARWDVTLPSRGITLSGIARTTNGRPVPDARVALLHSDGTSVAVADTGPDGTYAFTNLPPGDYTVITTGYPPVADVLRLDAEGGRYDPVLGHPEVP